jgi:hypothetical protein
MRKRGRPPYPDILTPREWEVLGELGVTNRYEAAAWQPTQIPWWRTALTAFFAWPFGNLWWGAGTKVAATAALAFTVAAFAIPDGFGLFATDPEIGPVPDYSNFSHVTSDGRVRLTDDPARDAGGAWSPDCSRIAFTSNRKGSIGSDNDIYTVDADGTNVVNLT